MILRLQCFKLINRPKISLLRLLVLCLVLNLVHQNSYPARSLDIWKLNPRNWVLHCWLALLVWLCITGYLNNCVGPRGQHLASMLNEHGNFTIHAGFPFEYLTTEYRQPMVVNTKWHSRGLLGNGLLILVNLTCLVFLIQYYSPGLTLRLLMATVAVFAILIYTWVALRNSE